jgi:hypothetical protein
MGRIYEYDSDSRQLYHISKEMGVEEARKRLVDLPGDDCPHLSYLFVEESPDEGGSPIVSLWACVAPDEPHGVKITLRYLCGAATLKGLKERGDDALYDTVLDSEYYNYAPKGGA